MDKMITIDPFWTILTIITITICIIACMFTWNYVSGQSYMNGNNTVANVTAIIDINDESRNASDMRYKPQLYPEFVWTEESIDKAFGRGSSNEHNSINKEANITEVTIR